MDVVFVTAAGAIAMLLILRGILRKETVFEFEKALFYRNGVLKSVLGPGNYWYLPSRTAIQKVDTRLKTVTVPAQEVLSSDNITVKVTLISQYEIVDPATALTKVENYHEALYASLQIALRELVGGQKIDDLVSKRQEIGKTVLQQCESKAKEYGLALKAVDVKDIMFPGDLKNVFAQVVKAQKQGLAALERTRGETASLRNLANAAKTLEGNPALMQLRMIQSVESNEGNTVVLGWPSQILPLTAKKDSPTGTSTPDSKETT